MALKITQTKGLIGTKKNQRDAVRGQINAVRHMVQVEEVAGE